MIYVAGFLFNKEKTRVLLIEKQKPLWQKGRLNGIGGKVKPNEGRYDAIRREFEEETGLFIVDWKLFCELRGSTHPHIVYFFSGIGELESARQIEEEKPLIVWTKKLPPNVMPNLRWLIPMALDPSEITALVIDNTMEGEGKG